MYAYTFLFKETATNILFCSRQDIVMVNDKYFLKGLGFNTLIPFSQSQFLATQLRVLSPVWESIVCLE